MKPESGTLDASRLPSTLSELIRSNSRSWACGGQVTNQALGRPDGGFGGIKSRLLQRFRPILAQIDRDVDQLRLGLRPVLAQGVGFEFQHLGLVELVDDGAVGPREAPAACVQAGRQDHHLPDAGVRRAEEELVEERRPGGHEVDHQPVADSADPARCRPPWPAAPGWRRCSTSPRPRRRRTRARRDH